MKPFLEFFPIILFFAIYKLYDIYTATAVLIVATFFQIAAYWLMYRKVETMQWITLGLILVFGGATLYLRDEQFIKWKLTIIEWLFGGAFLVSQFIGKKTFAERSMSLMFEQLLGENSELSSQAWKRLNVAWALFFFGVGLLNIYVMYHYSTDNWVMFKTFAVPILLVIFMATQMLVVHYLFKDQTRSAEAEK